MKPDLYDAFTGSASEGPYGNPYKELRYLVIDDHEATRHTLRLCIQTFGGFTVDQASSHVDAMHRIRRAMPDVILCDYILGDSRTGQQLLEELRRNGELPERAIFIMVTAERAYEKVISAVELAPDDYIIKPFAPELLRLRLEKVIQKKKAFLGFFALREEGKLVQALGELDRMLAKPANAVYRYDILRSSAAVQFERDALKEAAAIYEKVIAEYPFPWAKAGLARVLSRIRRYDEARAIVEEVIEQVPGYFDAYDLKAEICTHQGDFEEALATLTEATSRTPHNMSRKRSMSIAAGRSGDFVAARAIMDEVVRKDPSGDHSSAYLDLARLAMDAGDHEQAGDLLVCAEPHQASAVDEESALSLECMAAVMDGENGSGRFDRIRAQIVQTPQFSVNAAIDVARAALHFSDLQLANLIAERILSGPDARQAFTELLSIYRARNYEQPFRDLQREIISRRVARSASGL